MKEKEKRAINKHKIGIPLSICTKIRIYVRKIEKYLYLNAIGDDMIEEMMNSKVKAKVMKFMVANNPKSFTPSEVSAFAKLSKSRVSEILREFEKKGIVVVQQIGRSLLYSLNMQNDDVMIIIKSFKIDSGVANSALDEFAAECNKLFGINLLSIVLFGSRGRGTEDKASDFDLLVIIERKISNEILARASAAIGKKHSVRLDALVLSKDEFFENLHGFSPLFITMALGVKIVFDNNFFTKHFKEFLSRLMRSNFAYYEGAQKWDIRKIGSRTLQLL